MLSGCSQVPWLYRVNVQQGNAINPDMIKQLRVGMNKNQVFEIMGSPILMDTFNDNRWTYVFTFKPGNGPLTQKHLIIYFRNDRVSRIVTKNI
jgi:outer membrane protein assembly factor BamE